MSNETWRKIVYFDSESTLHPKETTIEHEPRLIVAEFWRRDVDVNGQRRDYEGQALCEKFYTDVDSFCGAKETVRVLAHNVGYDLLATGGIPILVKLGWKVDSLYEKGFTYILKLSKESRKLVFLSSTQFWTAPLAQVAKNFGMEKITQKDEEAKAQYKDPEELKRYCANDVAILRTAMNWLMDFLEENDYGSMRQTLPSLSYNIYKSSFMHYEIHIHNYDPAIRLERESYSGGRTEAWWLGPVPATCYKLDVNSMYPAMMEQGQFPIRLAAYYPDPELEKLRTERGRHFRIAEVTVVTEIPCIPKKRDGLKFPIGAFRTTLAEPELCLAEDAGLIVDVHQLAVYDSAPIFQAFIGHFYSRREAAKKEGLKAAAEMFKLLMNSLYGKFAMKSVEWRLIGEALPSTLSSEVILLPNGQSITLRTFGGRTWMNDGAVMESFDSFPAISSAVTSYARAYLWKLIQVAGLDNVYYMDTDSLFVNEEGLRALEEQGFVNEFRLGALKVEAVSTEVEIKGAKMYRWGKRVRHKGIPKDAEIVVVDGVQKAKMWIWPKIASVLKDGTLSSFSNTLMLKSIETPYQKGVVPPSKTGRVAPLTFYEP